MSVDLIEVLFDEVVAWARQGWFVWTRRRAGYVWVHCLWRTSAVVELRFEGDGRLFAEVSELGGPPRATGWFRLEEPDSVDRLERFIKGAL